MNFYGFAIVIRISGIIHFSGQVSNTATIIPEIFVHDIFKFYFFTVCNFFCIVLATKICLH